MAKKGKPSVPAGSGVAGRKGPPLGLGIFLSILLFLVMCNAWFTTEGAVTKLKQQRPQVTKVYSIERNFIRLSRVSAKENGKDVEICLDTDIFFDYEFSDCPEYDPAADYSF